MRGHSPHGITTASTSTRRQGANLDAGVFQRMPVSTNRSASSLSESSGTKTPLASLATGALVMATLVDADVQAVLRADGVVELIGAERIHGNVHRAGVAHLAHTQ